MVLDGGSWKVGTEELLKCVDVAICSADFMPPGCATGEDALRYLRGSGVREIAITNGANPILFASEETSGSLPVPYVTLVDTMGAGDIFHGAFCFYASAGLGFVESLQQAAKVASESCRFHGTRAWMRREIA